MLQKKWLTIQIQQLHLPLYQKKTYQSIIIYFNFFKNTLVQIPVGIQLFPFDRQALKRFFDLVEVPFTIKEKAIDHLVFEPSPEILREQLIQQFIKHMVYGALLQNKASEMSSRMIAMKNAKENATEFISDLTLTFNKARQWAITQEISEIVGAKMAME